MPAGSDLQRAVAQAEEGAVLCLEDGVYQGPIRIERPLTIWGSRRAVIRSSGVGTTVHATAPRVRLYGFTIDGSGPSFESRDAGVWVFEGEEAVLEGLHVKNAVFGILVEKSNRSAIRNNVVEGERDKHHGMRGDPIRTWETWDSIIEGNEVSHGRDLVLWYSGRNLIRNNTVRSSRYGSHTMYSHDNVFEGNRYVDNVVGIFLMYSRGVQLRRNVIADSKGAAGIGLGMKESGNVVVEENLFLHDTVGIYLDTSPLQLDEWNVIAGNEFRLCRTGVVFHSSPHRNRLERNEFRDDHQTVEVEGGGDALAVEWVGNYFDGYAGFDLDGDGTGDVPYELRLLSADLTGSHPSLAFFRGAPVLHLVNLAAEVLPLFAPRPLLRDPAPKSFPQEPAIAKIFGGKDAD